MENKYKLYDNIISATYINITSQSPDYIIFNHFNKDVYIDKVFLKVAFMVGNFEDKKIYINCKLFDYFKILFDNYSFKEIILRKYRIRHHRRPSILAPDWDYIAEFEAKEFEVDISIFKDIWKEYYQ